MKELAKLSDLHEQNLERIVKIDATQSPNEHFRHNKKIKIE